MKKNYHFKQVEFEFSYFNTIHLNSNDLLLNLFFINLIQIINYKLKLKLIKLYKK